jgi:hypothetical protein
MQYVTAKTLLAQVLLNHIGGERTEMAHSVESRPAFLDHHVVEYINSLPPYVLSSLPTSHDKPTLLLLLYCLLNLTAH